MRFDGCASALKIQHLHGELIRTKKCPSRAVSEQFPFPKFRVDDRPPTNLTSNEGLSFRPGAEPPGIMKHRSGSLLRLIANTEGQIFCGRSR